MICKTIRIPPPPTPPHPTVEFYLLKYKLSIMDGANHLHSKLRMHCTENLKQIFPEMKLRGLASHIQELWTIYRYIPTISSRTQYSKIGEYIVGIYKSRTVTWVQKLGARPCNFISGNFFWILDTVCVDTWDTWMLVQWSSPSCSSWRSSCRTCCSSTR